ncbi:HNH endonuclease signature motif containing protein [Diaphorobacter sp.]|uniref:HNH endonuclease n=1 Tax=Diaphorobacter sp. TaxID=1934310 RepID=UPI0028B12AA6|nr:HNH endonuclease signature motif containing protein [Diaphorobacter sp.]
MRLKMLKSTLPILDTTRGIKMLKTPRKAKATGRDADPRRVLPLTGAAWRKLRAHVLAGEPLCRHCAARGLVVEATDVDHVNGDPSDNSMDNLQSLCHSCHSTKTAVDHGKSVRTGHGIDGLPLSGEWAK